MNAVIAASDIIGIMYPQLNKITDKNTLTQLIAGTPEIAKQILSEYSNMGL
jgi:hypothetical protein